MNRFIGTKVVLARPMTLGEYNSYRGWPMPDDEDPNAVGYLIEYQDGGKPNHADHKGYISWSPQSQFDKAYLETDGMTFSMALDATRLGYSITRSGWNGAGMWVNLHRSKNPVVLPNYVLNYPEGSKAYPGGCRVAWAPSQTDMVADDWSIVEGK